MQREIDATIEVTLSKEIIETTAEHPFYTKSGWKDAADLDTKDEVKTKDGKWHRIEATNFLYSPKKVYNFEVSELHTYFVGAWEWLVHNAKVCISSLPKQLHHFATNKSKKYLAEFEDIAKKYGLDLDGFWNKELLPHRGRHPYKYHEWVLKEMQNASRKAGKNTEKFLELFEKTDKSRR